MPAILGPGSVSLETCASEAQARMYRIGKCTVLVALNFYRPYKYQNLALFTGLNPK